MKFKSRITYNSFPKITIVFIVIIFTVIVNAAFNIYLTNKQITNIDKISTIINPYIDNLDELSDILIESKMYATNWVHLPSEVDDKKNLDSLHKYRFNQAKHKIANYILKFKNKKNTINFNTDSLIPFISDFESLIKSQKKIMTVLVDFDDYENPAKKFLCENIIEDEILPKTKSMVKKLNSIVFVNNELAKKLENEIREDTRKISTIILMSSFGLLLFILTAVYFISTNIKKPVLEMNEIIHQLSEGQLPKQKLQIDNNIIGIMAQSVNALSESFIKTSEFANEIEKGNFSVQYNKLSSEDILGTALITMRDSLQIYSNKLNQKVTESTNEVIEKRKKIEDQTLFYESIFSNIPIEIAIFDKDFKYLFVNTIGVKDAELRKQIIGKDYFEYCKIKNYDTENAFKRFEIFKSVIQNGTAIDFEDSHINKKGKVNYNLRKFYPVFDEGAFKYMIGYSIDITEKKEQELNISDSLREKEALLGEIHHRVKNNLALVSGLIEMQRARTDNEIIRIQFTEIQQRINAMSLIHEKLYKSNNFIKIDLQDYLKDLVDFLKNFFDKNKNVTVHFELESVSISAKRAVPVALIVNELITNSFKYAFLDKKSGDIYVKLTKTQDEINLCIYDSGPGIPAEFDIKEAKSLGFKLINIFTKQLKGSFEYKNNPGLNVCVKFKDDL
jgi:two-component sensor histidine kinase/PAS domain-containing protein